MRKLAIVLIPLLILAFVIGAMGCGGKGTTTPTPTQTATPIITEEELVQGVLEAVNEISTVSFDLVSNNHGLVIEYGETSELYEAGEGTGSIDIGQRSAVVDITMEATYISAGVTERIESLSKMYIIDEVFYMGITPIFPEGEPEQWFRQPLEEGVWDNENPLRKHTFLLENADYVSIIGTELMNGIDCYVVNILPSSVALWQRVMGRVGDYITADEREFIETWTDVARLKCWYAKDTFLLMGEEVEFVMQLEENGNNVESTVNSSLVYYNHNEPVHIQLPPEAEKAEDLTISSQQEDYEVDKEVMQLASATFFSDVHSGWKDVNGDDNAYDASTFDDNVWGMSGIGTLAGHYYPTSIAVVGNHILKPNATELDPLTGNQRLDGGRGAATNAEITAHAIWMGLLVNAAGWGTQSAGSQDRDWVSPLQGETSLYLNWILESAMAGDTYNGGPELGGGYCWVVGKNGGIFGAYKAADGNWYAGFNGSYP